MQPVVHADVLGLVDQREVAVGAHQRHLLGDRRRHPGRDVLGGRVDRVLAHHPVGGVLAAGYGHQSGDGTATACSRDSLEVSSLSPASSGRSPA